MEVGENYHIFDDTINGQPQLSILLILYMSVYNVIVSSLSRPPLFVSYFPPPEICLCCQLALAISLKKLVMYWHWNKGSRIMVQEGPHYAVSTQNLYSITWCEFMSLSTLLKPVERALCPLSARFNFVLCHQTEARAVYNKLPRLIFCYPRFNTEKAWKH